MWFVDLTDRNPAQDLKRRGGWNWKSAVRALNETPPVVKLRNEHPLNGQRLQPHARTNDIRDRIERADLVKSDILRRNTMNLTLSDGDSLEDPQRMLFHER